MDRTKLHFETLQLHVGQEQADPATDARAVPIYQTTSYVFHNADDAAARFGLQAPGNIYGRLTNSTQGVFEERVAALEGGIAGLAVASGAAAISYAFENITRAGDHIVAAKTIYGGSYNLLAHTLPTYGVTTTFVDPENLDNFEQAIQENTKAVFIETLGNPNCNIIDIDAVADIAHRHRIPLIIDNTFGTPYLIRPIEHGADIVVHSATKLPRHLFHRRGRRGCLRHPYPRHTVARHGSYHQPVQCLHPSSGVGDLVLTGGTPRGEHPENPGFPLHTP